MMYLNNLDQTLWKIIIFHRWCFDYGISQGRNQFADVNMAKACASSRCGESKITSTNWRNDPHPPFDRDNARAFSPESASTTGKLDMVPEGAIIKSKLFPLFFIILNKYVARAEYIALEDKNFFSAGTFTWWGLGIVEG